MTYLDSWKAISARIRGLLAMSQPGLLPAVDQYGSWGQIFDQCKQIVGSLHAFADNFETSLPPDLSERITNEAVTISTQYFDLTNETPDTRRLKSQHLLVRLGVLETEVSFALTDTQAQIKARSELAFFHLQRTIAVDEDLKKKWSAAFDDGETACERLGAVHLLAHGIWAFKVNAEGERTDLVFQEPTRDVESVAMFAEGLVLTEWKKLKEGGNPDIAFAQARQQASDYVRGALAGSELRDYRFAVVVSRHVIRPPGDYRENGVMWKHVNIAVNPETPSKRHGRR